jgi:hypothetical protein
MHIRIRIYIYIYMCVCVYYVYYIYNAYIILCRWLVIQPVLILWALYLANLMPAGDSNGLVSLV